MQIKILGTRGQIKPTHEKYSNHSGILIDNKILIDVGEQNFLKYDPKYIFITHLHPDHAFFVRNDFSLKDGIDVPIYAPEECSKLSSVEVLEDSINLDEGYTIKPIPTHHSKKVKSQGYLIEKEDEKAFITGDMIWVDKEYHSLLEGLDLVITEGSYINKGGRVIRDKESGQIYGHTGIPNLINLFKKFTNLIVLTHFGSWFYRDIEASKEKIHEIAEKNNIDVIVSYDKMELEV